MVGKMSEVRDKCERAKKAAETLSCAKTETKNAALGLIAKKLGKNSQQILEAGKKDAKNAEALPKSVLKRLELNEKKLSGMKSLFETLQKFPDPVGSVSEEWKLENGIRIRRVRVPLGVLGFIYEARPNVTTEASA